MLHPYAFPATNPGRVPWPRSAHRRGARPVRAGRRRTRMRSRRSSSRTTGPGRGRRVPRSSTARASPSSGHAWPRDRSAPRSRRWTPRGGGGLGGSVHCRLRDAGPGYPRPAPRRGALGTGVVAARGWLATDPTAGWARPKIARDHSRALTREQIAALWCLDVGLREKTLWRLLYETAARATEILPLDIADLDRPGKRARVISKGGDTDWVYYQTGTALLLPRLLTGRTRGPVFLAERAPTRATPTLDLCPDTAGPDCPTAARPNCSNTPPHPSRPPPDSRQGGPCTNYAIPRLPTMPRAAPTPRCCSLGPDTPPCAPSSATPDPAPKPSPATPRPPTPPPDDAAARDSPSGRVNRPAPLASPNLSRSRTTAKRCRRPNGRRGGHDISSAVQSPATGGRTVCQ